MKCTLEHVNDKQIRQRWHFAKFILFYLWWLLGGYLNTNQLRYCTLNILTFMGWLLVSQPQVPDSADIHKVRLGLLGHESGLLWFRKTARWWALKVSSDWWLRMDFSWYLFTDYSSLCENWSYICYYISDAYQFRCFPRFTWWLQVTRKKHLEKKHVHRISSAPIVWSRKRIAGPGLGIHGIRQDDLDALLNFVGRWVPPEDGCTALLKRWLVGSFFWWNHHQNPGFCWGRKGGTSREDGFSNKFACDKTHKALLRETNG